MKRRRLLATVVPRTVVLLAVVLLAALAAGGIATFLLPGEGSSAYRTELTARARGVHPAARPVDHGVSVAETPRRACDRPTMVGTVATPKVVARAAPNPSARPIAKFGRRNVVGAPQVFDILRRVETGTSGVWFKALLPMRPNGTTGYIPAKALRLSETTYRLTISRRLFRLTLWEGCSRLKAFPIGIGTGKTPTPVGRFYLIALVKPRNPDTIYGSYAYGLSAYSDVITDWRGGGIIGLHGTNDPSSIGRRSSHGCIRMRNRHIESLVKILPLGVPVEIS